MKFCQKCGAQLEDDQNFCAVCGADQNPMNQESNMVQSNGFAVAAIICSFLIPLFGIIFGFVGLSKSKETKSGKNLSMAAIAISIIFIIINAIAIVNQFKNLAS